MTESRVPLGERTDESGDDVRLRSPVVYPRELVAFVICGKLSRETSPQTVSSAEIALHLRGLLDECDDSLRLSGFSFAEMPYGPVSPEVSDYLDFLRREHLVIHYNPTFVTEDGFKFCCNVIQQFNKHYPAAAQALARRLGHRLEELLDKCSQVATRQ